MLQAMPESIFVSHVSLDPHAGLERDVDSLGMSTWKRRLNLDVNLDFYLYSAKKKKKKGHSKFYFPLDHFDHTEALLSLVHKKGIMFCDITSGAEPDSLTHARHLLTPLGGTNTLTHIFFLPLLSCLLCKCVNH